MGYFAELNTLLKLPKGSVDISHLAVGKTFTVLKDKERIFPLRIAMLLADDDWNFLGYCVVHEAILKNKQTSLTFEVLSLFTPEQQSFYKQNFLEAAHKTGEIS
ncbi:hypothetical protein HYV22_04250 [Candidatus Gottesmanbacteria bacterium]|nr:hypothetical protein [Candidatus Gottesmanbacteria bacterium]